MDWIRRRPQAAAIVGVVAVIAVLTLVYVMVSSSGGTPGTRTIDDLGGQPSADPTLAFPTATPTTALPTAGGGAAGTGTGAGVGAGFSTANHGSSTHDSLSAPGYQGGSYSASLPKHTLVFRVTSAQNIGTVGWTLAYTDGPVQGRSDGVGKSWTFTRVVYGYPDFGRIFYSTGSDSRPITGRVYIDGKKTAECTTSGPYAQMMCQG